MTSCRHTKLVLLPEEEKRLRCRHCHLTIKADELETKYCPECFEVEGVRRYDFDEVSMSGSTVTRYRCEDCGVIIEIEPSKGE